MQIVNDSFAGCEYFFDDTVDYSTDTESESDLEY